MLQDRRVPTIESKRFATTDSHARHTTPVVWFAMELEEIFTPDDTDAPRAPDDDAVEL